MLPVEGLRLDDSVAHQLRRLGLTTIGHVAALPRPALRKRFGESLVRQIARAFGAAVVAIDVDARKLEAIAADGGAALALNSREHDAKSLKKAIAEFAKAQGRRSTEWKIFECSGSAPGQTTAFNLLVHGATLAVVGFTMDKVEVRLSNLMAFDARAIGNWGCPPEFYPAALDLVLDGRVKLAPFVETHPLADINHVFHAVHAREITRRAVLVP